MKSFLMFICLVSGAFAQAGFNFNQRLAVQGFLKGPSAPLATGSYAMKFLIKNNGATVWAKSFAGANKVSVVDGLFTQILGGTDDNSVSLASNLLDVANASSAVTVDVVVDLEDDGLGVGTDATYSNLDLVPAPLALLSHLATNLTQNGAGNGQFLMWNGSHNRWEPTDLSVMTLPANSIGSGQLAGGSVDNSKLAAGSVDLSSSTVTGALPVAKGGTGLNSLGAANQILAMNPLANSLEFKTITAGNGISISQSPGGIQINATTSGGTGNGTVTSVSAMAPLGVTTGATTPSISISNGTATGQALRWNAGTGSWEKTKLSYNDLVNTSSASPWPTSSCSSNQFLTWSAVSDAFNCTSILDATSSSKGLVQVGSGLSISGGVISLASGSVGGGNIATGSINNSHISNGAGIQYSKLNLTGSINENDLSSATQIPYSKLRLSASITDTDLSSSANISYGKLNLSGSIGTNDLAGKSVSAAKLADGSVDLASSSIANQLSLGHGGTGTALNASSGGIVYSSSSALAISDTGSPGQILQSNGTAPPTWKTLSPLPNTRGIINLWEEFMTTFTAPSGSLFHEGVALWTGASGAGSLAPLAGAPSGTYGVARYTTGTSTGNFAALGFCSQGNAMGTPSFSGRFESNDNWTFEIRLSVSNTSANSGLLRLGLPAWQSATAGNPQGVYLEYGNGNTNVTAYSRDASGVQNSVQSAVAASTYTRWTISYDGSKVHFYKNGIEFGAGYAANIPVGTAVCPGLFYTSGSVARNIDIDYIAYNQTTNAR